MIDNHFRAVLPLFVRPLLTLYQRLGVTPNQITIVGCGLGIVASICVAWDLPVAALIIWWVGRLLDGTDGIWARETQSTSSFGAFLDIVCDMAAYGAMILGFYWAYPTLSTAWTSILFGYILCITSALALGTQEDQLGVENKTDRGLRLGAGLAEGGETGIAYTLFLLFPACLPWLAWSWFVVLAITVVSRVIFAHRLHQYISQGSRRKHTL